MGCGYCRTVSAPFLLRKTPEPSGNFRRTSVSLPVHTIFPGIRVRPAAISCPACMILPVFPRPGAKTKKNNTKNLLKTTKNQRISLTDDVDCCKIFSTVQNAARIHFSAARFSAGRHSDSWRVYRDREREVHQRAPRRSTFWDTSRPTPMRLRRKKAW